MCKLIFTKLDINGDGKIKFDDFKKAFWSQGSNRAETSLKEAFNKAVNTEGIVDLEELCNFFKPKIN